MNSTTFRQIAVPLKIKILPIQRDGFDVALILTVPQQRLFHPLITERQYHKVIFDPIHSLKPGFTLRTTLQLVIL
jgi:hypothetical protein